MDSRPSARDQKKAAACRGVIAFEDEASFWVDGTLHRTWSRIGQQPRVDTYGARKTAHVFGAIRLDDAHCSFCFADKFNGRTFLGFLQELVEGLNGRKLFLIIDNAPAHNLEEEGVAWLRANRRRIELHRLPPYSPEFNPVEGVWKTLRKLTTHNRFFPTPADRDEALLYTFARFQDQPHLVAPQVARFR